MALSLIADTLGLSPVEAHFGSLDPSLAHVAYLNHEAVPEEVTPDPGGSDSGGDYNYFDQVTLFRRNPHCIPGFWATQMHLYASATMLALVVDSKHVP